MDLAIIILAVALIIMIALALLLFRGVADTRAALRAERMAHIEAQATLGELAGDLEEATAPRTLERFERKRLMVNGPEGRIGWRGILHAELDDAIVLDAVEILQRAQGGSAAIEAAPGLVVIPADKIEFVQVLRDDE